MWYLRLFRRHKLDCKVMRPVVMVAGTVFYQTTWVLKAA
jgi:hypothetical protein